MEKVLDMRRLKADQPYPRYQKYFLAGNRRNVFMTHIPTKCKDFQQVSVSNPSKCHKTNHLLWPLHVNVMSVVTVDFVIYKAQYFQNSF